MSFIGRMTRSKYIKNLYSRSQPHVSPCGVWYLVIKQHVGFRFIVSSFTDDLEHFRAYTNIITTVVT